MKKPLILLAYTWLIFGAFYLTTPTKTAPNVTVKKEVPTSNLPLSFKSEEVKLGLD